MQFIARLLVTDLPNRTARCACLSRRLPGTLHSCALSFERCRCLNRFPYTPGKRKFARDRGCLFASAGTTVNDGYLKRWLAVFPQVVQPFSVTLRGAVRFPARTLVITQSPPTRLPTPTPNRHPLMGAAFRTRYTRKESFRALGKRDCYC